LIPAPTIPGRAAKQAGCAVFIDRQLAGSFGDSRGPLHANLHLRMAHRPQGLQSANRPEGALPHFGSPRLEDYCKTTFAGKGFSWQLTAGFSRIKFLTGPREIGEIKLKDGSQPRCSSRRSSRTRFEGFFADPIYGGNRDMAGWKLIGFPGIRYDYRDPTSPSHNQPLPGCRQSRSLGRSDWSVRD